MHIQANLNSLSFKQGENLLCFRNKVSNSISSIKFYNNAASSISPTSPEAHLNASSVYSMAAQTASSGVKESNNLITSMTNQFNDAKLFISTQKREICHAKSIFNKSSQQFAFSDEIESETASAPLVSPAKKTSAPAVKQEATTSPSTQTEQQPKIQIDDHSDLMQKKVKRPSTLENNNAQKNTSLMDRNKNLKDFIDKNKQKAENNEGSSENQQKIDQLKSQLKQYENEDKTKNKGKYFNKGKHKGKNEDNNNQVNNQNGGENKKSKIEALRKEIQQREQSERKRKVEQKIQEAKAKREEKLRKVEQKIQEATTKREERLRNIKQKIHGHKTNHASKGHAHHHCGFNKGHNGKTGFFSHGGTSNGCDSRKQGNENNNIASNNTGYQSGTQGGNENHNLIDGVKEIKNQMTQRLKKLMGKDKNTKKLEEINHHKQKEEQAQVEEVETEKKIKIQHLNAQNSIQEQSINTLFNTNSDAEQCFKGLQQFANMKVFEEKGLFEHLNVIANDTSKTEEQKEHQRKSTRTLSSTSVPQISISA